MRIYKLVGKTPVLCDDLMEGMTFCETQDRTVRVTETELHTISTVFLCIDHNWRRDSAPVLFETMVFGRDVTADPSNAVNFGDEGIIDRYSTWEEAEYGHTLIVGEVLRREREALVASNFHKKLAD